MFIWEGSVILRIGGYQKSVQVWSHGRTEGRIG